MRPAAVVFWAALFFAAYPYALYPLLLAILSRFVSRPVKREDRLPEVTVIVPVHNQPDAIRAKIENLLELDYPRERLQIVIASDGSTDATDEIVRSFSALGVRLVRSEERRGKEAAQNRGVDGDLIWILQGWGMTETSPVATISYPRAELQGASADEKFRRAAMAGVPVPLVELRARGDDGQDQPWDGHSVGEIQVRGPFITGGYFPVGAPEDKFTPDGWLRTGDVASVDALGFVKISDRTKDLIKSGGEWISSVDLENALMAHPAVSEAAVIAIPDDKWSERPLACVVLKPGEQATADEFNTLLLTKSFAKWQLPERYEFIDAVPRTSTGKFWKLKLRERFPR